MNPANACLITPYLTIPQTVLGFIFLAVSRTVVSMCFAAIAMFAIGLMAARKDVAEAHGVDKIVALVNLCFATPLAVFGTEHFALAAGISQLVPKFMPWPLFWTYVVGVALLAASLSIAARIHVLWSGLGFGTMMFLFVAMMDLPAALKNPHDRFAWMYVLRELSFSSGGWLLAARAMNGQHRQGSRTLFTVGRVVIGIAAVVYGVEHFLHPFNVPGVPLEKLMPTWIPGRDLISYLTGAVLLVAGVCILLAKKTRVAATYLAAWILLLVLLVYGAILIAALLDPSTDVKVDWINYFLDTLLYAGVILALAKATPQDAILKPASAEGPYDAFQSR